MADAGVAPIRGMQPARGLVRRALLALAIPASDAAGMALAFFLSAWLAHLLRTALLPEVVGNPLARHDVVLSRGIVFATIAAALVLWFASRGHYRQRHSVWFELRDIAVGCGIAILGDAFLQYAAKEDFSRLWLTGGWVLAAVLVPSARRAMRALLSLAGLWQVPVFFIGSDRRRSAVEEAFAGDPALGYHITTSLPLEAFSFLLEDGDHDRMDERARHLLATSGLAQQHRLVLGPGHDQMELAERLADVLEGQRRNYAVAAPLSGIPLHGLEQQYFLGRDLLLLTIRNNLERPVNRAAKRLSDIAAATLALAFLSPLLLVLYVLVRLDGGPAIYGQTRLGRGGERFRCWKFRSMVVDADRRLKDLLERDPEARAAWDKDFKLKNDPRITTFGRALRLSGLDELPQLWNVLCGQMSLVGPRPVVESEIERYGKGAFAYFSVRPGITGLWQVSGRNDVDYPTRVAFDQWYTRNWSLWLDFVILLKTVPAVLARRGAY